MSFSVPEGLLSSPRALGTRTEYGGTMYGRPALGALLPLAGAMAAPEAIPGLPLAKALQAIAGAGFLIYCLTACLILLARIHLRRRGQGMRAHAGGSRDH